MASNSRWTNSLDDTLVAGGHPNWSLGSISGFVIQALLTGWVRHCSSGARRKGSIGRVDSGWLEVIL